VKVVCGLGNPGEQYARTRHNVGFLAVEFFAEPLFAQWTRKHSARVARVRVQREDVLLVEPQTFMNLSGLAVAEVVRFHRVPEPDLLVVHDDADLPFGRLRMQAGGGDGGHKGVQSVVSALGASGFARLRIGIGRPRDSERGLTDHVLSGFEPEEWERLGEVLRQASLGIEDWLLGGVPRAQNRVNRRERPVRKPSCREPVDSRPSDRKEDA